MGQTRILNSLAGYILKYSNPLFNVTRSTNFARRSGHFDSETRGRIIMEKYYEGILLKSFCIYLILLNTDQINMLIDPVEQLCGVV